MQNNLPSVRNAPKYFVHNLNLQNKIPVHLERKRHEDSIIIT